MTTPDSLAVRTHHWLSAVALPIWLERGFDRRLGFFHEGLMPDLTPVDGPVRTMVQARQIYSFRVALDLDLCPMEVAARAITAAARTVLDQCANEDGSYAHSIHPGLGVTRATPELYTQAFVIFGLAQAFALAPMPEYARRAAALLDHLNQHRATRHGGFTEIDAAGQLVHRSNPLMHLFEAALAWMEFDRTETRWIALADQLANLAHAKLIDPSTGLIAEEFDGDWRPARENERFYWEPGHQFEWAWLLARHQQLTGRDHAAVVTKLYDLATAHGLERGRVIDQAWSDLTPKLASARFWPQAERVKAAVARGDAAAAAEALGALTSYLDVPRPGLWCDVMDESGQRDQRPSKASSLYHIIGAMSEYLTAAPRLNAGPAPLAGRGED